MNTAYSKQIVNSLILACAVLFSHGYTLADETPIDKQALLMQDKIKLKSGAVLAGELISDQKVDGRRVIEFKTSEGSLLRLDYSKVVSKLRLLDESAKAYNQRLQNLSDTAESHRELWKWCEEQPSGTSKFKAQIQFHLERILELDPNDKTVKSRLGFKFIESQGRWVHQASYFKSLGYTKNGTSWAPTISQDVASRQERFDKVAAERKRAFAKWKKSLRKSSLAQIEQELFNICQPGSVTYIFEKVRDEKDIQLRRIFVEAFGRVPTFPALETLVFYAVRDPSADIRDRALTLLGQEHYNPREVAGRLQLLLGDSNNRFINRAAFVIGELGNNDSILPLANALETRHQVSAGDQPGRINPQFGNNGLSGLSLGGNSGPKFRNLRNPEVASALRKLTNQDFGFSTEAWEDWYIEQHSIDVTDLRKR